MLTYEDLLICDLAETYGVFDLESLPVETVAILATGLGENSRIIRKLSGAKVPINTLLLAHIADRLGLLVWQNTKDGKKNRNRPKSFVEAIEGAEAKTYKGIAFENPEDFWAARETLMKGL